MLKTAIVIGFVTLYSALPANAQTRALADAERNLIAREYGARLKDPSSAQYQWAQIPIADNLKGGQVAYCFKVNAKNSYGGYAGFKVILGKLKRVDGKIIAFEYTAGANDDTAARAETTAELCRLFGSAF